jgi:Phasin protein
MTERSYDFQTWLEPYKETFASFAKAQQEGLRTLERFARFHYAVAGDLLEAGLAQARAALEERPGVGTQAIAELLQRQAELGTQLSERLRTRAQEFSALAAEVRDSVGSFAADSASRAADTASRAAGAKKAA